MSDLLKYEQKTEKEHILSNPDTFLGSVEKIHAILWILNATGDKFVQKNIEYIAAMLKLLDETIVNARDHWVRQQQAILNGVPNALPVTYIHVVIQDDGTIEITNDGSGIDVAEHPEYKKWIPELIFANMRTSTNYNKEEEKIVGGKNGQLNLPAKNY